MNKINTTFLIIICLICNSCIDVDNKFSGLPPGKWRAIFKLYDQNIDQADLRIAKADLAYKALPFNFEVSYVDNNIQLEIINGQERIPVNDIKIGIDRATAKDTIIIDFPVYNSYIKAIYEDGIMEGNWFVNHKKGYSIPFIAKHGLNHRFSNAINNVGFDISGKWKTTFDFDKDEPYMAIGEFKQTKHLLEGTFLTETGDFRYLDGEVNENKMLLSTFDGAHAFLFEALISHQDTMIGIFKSGKHYTSNFMAVRDSNFKLTDPYNLSKVVEPNKAIDFSFEDTNGKMVSISDDAYASKIKLVNIVGSWCPNCKDEIRFLNEFVAKEKYADIQVLSICFEKYKEKEKATKAIRTYKEKMNVNWPMLYGGYANKKENQKDLPFLDKIISYPTLLVLDQNNKIKFVHTGFAGPATSKFKNFEEKFYTIIDDLLKK